MKAPLSRLLVACLLLMRAGNGLAEPPLVLAVVPQFPALEIHRTWTPVAKAVESAIGRTVELKLYQSIPQFEQEFLAGAPDLVYLNPYHMVMAKKAVGYVPLVRDDAQKLSGLLVVQAGSPLTKVADLDGKTIAFPAPNAFGASLLPRALLADQFKVRFTANYVQTHSNAYRFVARGDVAAAGGIRTTFEREPEELRGKLRILYETPAFASHPVAAHPRLKPELRAKFVKAILQMRQTREGSEQLAAVLMHDPVPADYARDYANLERLGLDRHVLSGN